MRKIFVAFLGAVFGLALFAVQVRAQVQPQQMPVLCGDYKSLAEGLTKIGEHIVGRGTNAMGVIEFWLDTSKGSGSVVLRVDMDRACLVLDIEGFSQIKGEKGA